MLLMDGVRYEEWTPPDEAVLAGMVKEHARDILGEGSIYLDIRHKLKGGSVAAIPDAYAITFDPDQWWVVEVELSSHPVYEHIVNQLSRFINGARDPQTRSELVEAFYTEITADQHVKTDLVQKRGQEVHRFLSQIVAQPAQYVVAIDKKVPQLDAAVQALAVQPKIVEFHTFQRVGAEAVHIHQFEPLFKPATKTPSQPKTPPTAEDVGPVAGAPLDTIVVPARKDGFVATFLGKDRWYAIRIHESRIPQIKYVAAYQVAPVSAITHWAPVRSIEPWPEKPGKYVVNFADKAQEIGPIRLVRKGKVKAPQGPRYTSFPKLQRANTLDEVF